MQGICSTKGHAPFLHAHALTWCAEWNHLPEADVLEWLSSGQAPAAALGLQKSGVMASDAPFAPAVASLVTRELDTPCPIRRLECQVYLER